MKTTLKTWHSVLLLLLFTSGAAALAQTTPTATFVVLPDTQYYVHPITGHTGTMAMFTTQTSWIQSHAASSNIVYVAQLGDITDNGDEAGFEYEWNSVATAMYLLESPISIPYGVAVGNHDQAPNWNDATTTLVGYNQKFGYSHFSGRPYYGGRYSTANNENHYDFFTAQGVNYIVIYLEFDDFNTLPGAVTWASNLMTTYKDRKAIVITHSTLDGNTFKDQAQRIYDTCKTHPNFLFMHGGHTGYNGRRQDTYGGFTVTTFMTDYQSLADGGSGYLRLYNMEPANDLVQAYTFTPYGNYSWTDDNGQFSLRLRDSGYNMYYRSTNNALKMVQWWQSGGQWTNSTTLVSSGLLTSPGSCSWGPGRMDAFWQGSGNTLQRAYYSAGWHTDTVPGVSNLAGKPDACCECPNNIDVYYRGTDNNLYIRSWTGSIWQGSVIPGTSGMLSDPGCASRVVSVSDAVWRASGNSVGHAWYDGGWHTENLGQTNMAGAPDMCSMAQNTLDIFYRGTDNALWQKSLRGTWQTAVSLGGSLGSEPTVSSWGQQRMDVSYKGTDGNTYVKSYDGVWHAAVQVPGVADMAGGPDLSTSNKY